MIFDSVWRSQSTIECCDKHTIDAMVGFHYLHKWPGVVVAKHVMKVNGNPMGMVVWALPPRETEKRYGGKVWELARLWVDDAVPNNAETWLIAKSVKWIKNNRPDVQFLISYADPSAGHSGIIYKAANWMQDGRTDQGRKTPRCDYVDSNGKKYGRRCHIPGGVEFKRIPRISKFRFVYCLNRRIKND